MTDGSGGFAAVRLAATTCRCAITRFKGARTIPSRGATSGCVIRALKLRPLLMEHGRGGEVNRASSDNHIHPDTISARVRRTVPVHVSEVFEFVADATHDPLWIKPIVHSRRLDTGPVGVGSRFEQRAAAWGRRAHFVWEITHYELDRRMAVKSVSGTYSFIGGYEFIEQAGGTVVTKFGHVRRAGLLLTVPRFVASELMRKQFEGWLDSLASRRWSNAAA